MRPYDTLYSVSSLFSRFLFLPNGLYSRKYTTTAPNFTFQHSHPPGSSWRVLAPRPRSPIHLCGHRAGSERDAQELFVEFVGAWCRTVFGNGRSESSLCPEDFVGRESTDEILLIPILITKLINHPTSIHFFLLALGLITLASISRTTSDAFVAPSRIPYGEWRGTWGTVSNAINNRPPCLVDDSRSRVLYSL